MTPTLSFPAAVSLALVQAAAAAPSAVPERRPGWWRLEIATQTGAPQPMRQTVHLCTDPSIDRVQTPFGVHTGRGCPPNRVSRAGDGWDIAASCQVGAMAVTTQGHLTGDLASAYRVVLTVRMQPPPTPQTGEIHVTMDARREGACPADKRPGDLDLSMHTSEAGAR